jgi:LacI family transcriptional regulator
MKPSPKKRRLPTMNDVAKAAGVSQTTVSFVVNDIPDTGITDETRARVLSTIKELGYRPRMAKLLHGQQTRVIGVITDQFVILPYGRKIMQGIQETAWEQGKMVIWTDTEQKADVEQSAIEMMLERQVEGMLYVTLSHEIVTVPAALQAIPTVLVNCCDRERSFPSVVPDEVGGGMAATKALLAKGHRRIGFINGPQFAMGVSIPGRFEGYTRALAEYGVPLSEELVIFGADQPDHGYDYTMRFMRLAEPPTALFCYNDHVAMGAYAALAELALKIPEDVAVVGFDNFEIVAAFLRPGLSTMELPHYEMGQWAVKYLLKHHKQSQALKPVQQTMACPYIERGSV